MWAITLLTFVLLIDKGQAPHFKVRQGLKHSSITLSTSFYPHSQQPREVIWYHKKTENEYLVAKYQNGNPTMDSKYNMTRNGTQLVINDLNETDNGVYRAEATLEDGTIVPEYFNVSVYDPVPSPAIWHEVMENTAERCNVTLHCSVPSNTSDLSYTWKYRHQDPEYHLYNTGSVIQISVNYDSRDMEILCIVQNPADQKNVSYTVRHICPHLVTTSQSVITGDRRQYYILAILLLVVLLALGFFFFKQYIKRGKTTKERVKEELKKLTDPVQDTETQESLTIDILHEEDWMKTKESDEEGSEPKDKPGYNRSSVIKVEAPEEVKVENPEKQKVKASEEVKVEFPEERKEEFSQERKVESSEELE